MGRGSKFSFPIPGRRNHVKETVDTSTITSVDSHFPEYREHDPSQSSKAERLLGTSGLAVRQPLRSQLKPRSTQVPLPEPPQSPGYMTVTVSEASFGSDNTDHASSTAVEDAAHSPRWRSLHPRPSSNLLGPAYNDDRGRSGSISSSISRRLHGQASNSTLRSFYDAQKSPLAVSQQTSASAVRDMALRKGERPVQHTAEHAMSTPNLSSHRLKEEKQQTRKNKPARLDLSRLFPRPRGQDSSNGALLSPTKMVNSPMPLSATSEYFPRHPPAQRRETPAPSTKSARQPEMAPPKTASSRVERPNDQKRRKAQEKEDREQKAFKRDVFDNAKVNVRRPPHGIQHWFEGLEEEDEDDEDDIPPPPPIPQSRPPPANLAPARLAPLNLAPVRKSSLGRVLPREVTMPKVDRTEMSHLSPATQMEFYKSATPKRALHRQRSASQQSMDSHMTGPSSRRKFSSSNLQDASVLSMSSSEDEYEAASHKPIAPVRDSLAVSTDNEGEIIIGKAQAFEVKPRPRQNRNESHRRLPSEPTSTRSVSTSAATIEVMLSPDFHSSYLPRHSNTKALRHSRQPSAIPEHEARPRTSSVDEAATTVSPPMSPRSARTSCSEPRSRSEQHKLMAVTEEEEALLEMMRRKRAAMAKYSFTEGYKTALTQAQKRGDTPTSRSSDDAPPRTSGFLVMDSPNRTSTDPLPSLPSSYSKGSVSSSDTIPLLGSGNNAVRGRTKKTRKPSIIPTSILRDTSSSDSNTPHLFLEQDSPARNNQQYQLSAHLDFAPLDPFPPTPTSASIASPTTASHASPLPSPVTPGRHGESNLDVKVAGSEPSCNGDEELVHSSSSTDPFMTTSLEKLHDSHRTTTASHRPRRRTASSGTDVVLGPEGIQSQSVSYRESQMSQSHHQPAQPFHQHAFDSLDSSDTPDLYHSEPKSSRTRSARRTSSIVAAQLSSRTSVASSTTPSTAPTSRSVRDSRISKSSRLSRENSLKKRESMASSAISTRCSVSDDVLAAWGSLGGWRTFEERV